MKAFLTGLVVGAILSGAAVWRFHETAPEAGAGQEEKPVDHSRHGKDGTTSIELGEAERQQMGLVFQPVVPATLNSEVKAYGRVMNASELPLMLAEINVAEVALKGSKLAYERLSRLNGEAGTVSIQKVEEAGEVMKKDEVAVQTAKVKLATAWGQSVAHRVDIEALAGQIASNDAALIRLDLSPGETSSLKTGRVALPGSEDRAVEVEILGPAPAADPVTQSASLICLMRARAWVPGSAVVGWLSGTGKGVPVVCVPRSALLRHEGMVFVYLRHEDSFSRVPVEPAQPSGSSWLVRSTLKAGDEVVVIGAQQLLAEELKGQTGED